MIFTLRLLHIFTVNKQLGPKIVIVSKMVSLACRGGSMQGCRTEPRVATEGMGVEPEREGGPCLSVTGCRPEDRIGGGGEVSEVGRAGQEGTGL